MSDPQQVFLSYAGEDRFEASLLQWCLEHLLQDVPLKVWTFERDQPADERNIARALPETIKKSAAAIFLLSPFTIDGGATQWMELAYADAFAIPTFVLLNHVTYEELKKSDRDVPPIVLQGECRLASEWLLLEGPIRVACGSNRVNNRSASEK
jgi:TIR domain-containing protein